MSKTDPSPEYMDLADLDLAGFEGEICQRYTSPEGLAWLRELPGQLAGHDTDLIYRLRNRIYRLGDPLDAENPGICVKAFKAPPLLRSIYYRTHGSKAERAHRYARHLYTGGAGVAEPIGYIERWQGKRLVESYLLTRYLSDATDLYTEMTHLLRVDPDAGRFVALMRFAATAIRQMHDSGFVHNDLGAQNFLMRRQGPAEWSHPVFIDLNRGRPCGEVSLKLRARDMSRLEIPSHFLNILYRIYFNDGPVPDEFTFWEQRYRARIRRHRATGKYRHPIRSLRKLFQKNSQITISTGRPPERDIWLWDEKSGQPSVVLTPRDRRKHRDGFDYFRIAWANLRRAYSLRKHYLALKAQAYTQPISMADRLGVCVEVDGKFDQQLTLLRATPGLPVFVRCYFHKGQAGLAACVAAIENLAAAGHPVSIGIIQSRQAVINLDQWQAFVRETTERTHQWLGCVEIGHAVNRVKWGFWNLAEMNAIWQGVAELRQAYPQLTILGPAINDFEYHYYPPLLDNMAQWVDGLSCHLYVDRRGQPENFQGRFSTLEKCIYGRAVAQSYGKKSFYITETNWPLKNTGDYSPLAGAYHRPGQAENPLHVDERTSAAYFLRFALIALCSGMVDQIWWWRLAHHGFGLVDDLQGMRERPGWRVLVHFHNTLGSDKFVRREESSAVIWWHFERCSLAYALTPASFQVPPNCRAVLDMCGEPLPAQPGDTFTLAGEPVYVVHG